jgi:hypothetical protein
MAYPTTEGRKNFFVWLNNPHAMGTVIDRDFDDENDKPVTAELLDWHQTRHWPVHVTD